MFQFAPKHVNNSYMLERIEILTAMEAFDNQVGTLKCFLDFFRR